jgi:hypothetical protein
MLTYADVCGRMLTYADVLTDAARKTFRWHHSQTLLQTM